MKKLLLGMGILALSAAALGAYTNSGETVEIKAKIVDEQVAVVLYDSLTAGTKINEVIIDHGTSEYGNVISAKISDEFYVALENSSGNQIDLVNNGNHAVVATIASSTELLKKNVELGEHEAHQKFGTDLEITKGTISNGRKPLKVISTPKENSKNAVHGNYEASETLTITINKVN